MMMRSKCPGENIRRPSSSLLSMAFIIVGYVENTMRLVVGSSLLSSRLQSVSLFLKNSVNAVFACFTSAFLSARKRIFFALLYRVITSVMLMATRVLPVPVACTMSMRR